MMSSFQNNFLALVGIVLFFSSCKKDSGQTGNLEAKVVSDISYGAHAKQKMDVYLPVNRTGSTPVLIMLHGGSFYGGDKSDYTPVARKFADAGYAVVNMNYRLIDTSGVFRFPPLRKLSDPTILGQVDDVKLAVDFVAQNASSWSVSTSAFAIGGHSAGGTLAMLYAYNSNDVRIKAVANWAGVTDFTFADESYAAAIGPNLAEIGNRFTGFPIKNEFKSKYMAISPVHALASTSGKPTINILPENNFVFGLPDSSKPQYDALTALLNQKQQPNKFVLAAGADHAFSMPGNFDLVVKETTAFFSLYVK